MAYIHNYMLLEIKRNLFINTTELYVIVVTSNVTLWFPLWILCKFFVLLWYFLTIITVFCKNGRVFCFFFLVLFNRFHRYWCFPLLACACHNNYNGKIRPTHFFFYPNDLTSDYFEVCTRLCICIVFFGEQKEKQGKYHVQFPLKFASHSINSSIYKQKKNSIKMRGK